MFCLKFKYIFDQLYSFPRLFQICKNGQYVNKPGKYCFGSWNCPYNQMCIAGQCVDKPGMFLLTRLNEQLAGLCEGVRTPAALRTAPVLLNYAVTHVDWWHGTCNLYALYPSGVKENVIRLENIMFVEIFSGPPPPPPPPPPRPTDPCDGVDCSSDPNSQCNPDTQACECKSMRQEGWRILSVFWFLLPVLWSVPIG